MENLNGLRQLLNAGHISPQAVEEARAAINGVVTERQCQAANKIGEEARKAAQSGPLGLGSVPLQPGQERFRKMLKEHEGK
ncbi:hypothetical protein GF362_06955 [Candidatus Dojkabacteria bacterium]|nr:hypothetical protein [Candidatus Dojkabacteria bacterium]